MSEFYEEIISNSNNYYNRYKNCKVLKDKSTGETLLSAREITEIPISNGDTYITIDTPGSIRLDVLAEKYYSNPLLWWVIALANNIRDPFLSLFAEDISLDPFNNFSPVVLRIPNIESLYGNRGILL